jgi:Uma2 family endonuclease
MAASPGTDFGGNVSLLLDFENEVQPDALLRLETTAGGQSKITASDYLEGPPELIVEIAASSAAYDLRDKKRVYARNGVPEYLVIQMYEKRIDWFVLREGVYESLVADERDILQSEIFPGLWLAPAAFWDNDLAALLAILQKGLASPVHQTFVKNLQAKN